MAIRPQGKEIYVLALFLRMSFSKHVFILAKLLKTCTRLSTSQLHTYITPAHACLHAHDLLKNASFPGGGQIH